MSVKDILVFLDESSASNERLRLAMNLAKDHHACLSAAFSQDDRTPETAINVGLARFPAMGDQPEHSAAVGRNQTRVRRSLLTLTG
jgi:hypothetical protein